MSKILAVFGATGQQGGSVVRYVLSDPQLSKEYTVRAITRNASSDAANDLRKLGAEVVVADQEDTASLHAALKGVHSVFAITVPNIFRPDCADVEYQQAVSIGDAAVAQGVSLLVFSTLHSVSGLTGGKYHFIPDEGKSRAEAYLRSLTKLRTAFYAPGWFMENFLRMPWLPLTRDASGSDAWTMSAPVSSSTRIGLVATVDDTGKYIGAILADPDRYSGKTIYGSTALYSLVEIAAIIGRVTGKTVTFRQTESKESYLAGLPDIFPRDFLQDFVDLFAMAEEVGYFGPDSEKLVAWSTAQARGKLTTLEQFLTANPIKLE